MTDVNHLIAPVESVAEALINAGWYVTMYDAGQSRARLVLAVKTDKYFDLWYLRGVLDTEGLWVGRCAFDPKQDVAYFPDLVVDATTYKRITNL